MSPNKGINCSDLDTINVCLSSDSNYEPHLWVNISSMIENSSSEREYYLYVLDGGIERKKAFYELIEDHSNFHIEFIDMGNRFLDAYESRHVKKAAYYRLAIFEIFKDLNKILYIDADSYVLSDIGELFDIDLEGSLVAGVRDSINYELPWREKHITHESYSGKAINYFSDYLNLPEEKIRDYFSSGILLFNLEEINKDLINEEIQQLLKRSFYSHDQDILNLLFDEKETYLLGREWNYFNSGPLLKEKEFFLDEEKENYLNGKVKPKIVSYVLKPWLKENLDVPYAREYWLKLEESPYLEKVKKDMLKNTKIKRFLRLPIKNKIRSLVSREAFQKYRKSIKQVFKKKC